MTTEPDYDGCDVEGMKSLKEKLEVMRSIPKAEYVIMMGAPPNRRM